MKQADIAVYDPDGQLQLVVEIKNRLGASAEWAARLRHNLLVHSFIPRAPYFLLALPDFFIFGQTPCLRVIWQNPTIK